MDTKTSGFTWNISLLFIYLNTFHYYIEFCFQNLLHDSLPFVFYFILFTIFKIVLKLRCMFVDFSFSQRTEYMTFGTGLMIEPGNHY